MLAESHGGHMRLILWYNTYIVEFPYTMKALFLILASAALVAPAGAAEIGVRHTWGHTTTNMYNGRSVTRGTEHSSSTERTDIGGHHSTRTVRSDVRFRESYDFNGTRTGGFSETSVFSR